LLLRGNILDDDDAVIGQTRRRALQRDRQQRPYIALILAEQPLLQPVAVDFARERAFEFADIVRAGPQDE
jgi:hypothetical protein